MPRLYILIGVPGSGKSTWAKDFGESAFTLVIISPDDIRASLGDVMDQSKNAEVWELAYDAVVDNLDRGWDVILDATAATLYTRKKSIEVGHSMNAEVIGVYFPVSAELAKERNKGRERVVPEHVIDRMIATLNLHPPHLGEGFNDLYTVED